MKKLPLLLLPIFLVSSLALFAQNSNSSTTTTGNANNTNVTKKPRKPVFRATVDQIKQAQAILKQRGFYAGEETGKLNTDTRAGLKKYQEAEKLKVTGTLNKVTLEKMAVVLTDKQKKM